MDSKYIQGKKAIVKSSQVIVSKILTPPYIGFFNLGEQVNHMVCLAEIVLYVVVVCLISKFAELVFERAALLEKTMDFAVNCHRKNRLPPSKSVTPRKGAS